MAATAVFAAYKSGRITDSAEGFKFLKRALDAGLPEALNLMGIFCADEAKAAKTQISLRGCFGIKTGTGKGGEQPEESNRPDRGRKDRKRTEQRAEVADCNKEARGCPINGGA